MSSGGVVYIEPNGWNGSSSAATTWSGNTTIQASNSNQWYISPESMRATLSLQGVDVQLATPVPRTEVDRLLAEVDAVCALAR